MIEQDLERKIISVFDEVLGDLPHKSTGLWQFAAAMRESDVPATLEVDVHPHGFEIETTPCAVFQCAVRLIFRREIRGADIIGYLELMQAKLDAWHRSLDLVRENIGLETLDIVGFTFAGGTIEPDPNRSAYVWEQSLTLRGAIYDNNEEEGE